MKIFPPIIRLLLLLALTQISCAAVSNLWAPTPAECEVPISTPIPIPEETIDTTGSHTLNQEVIYHIDVVSVYVSDGVMQRWLYENESYASWSINEFEDGDEIFSMYDAIGTWMRVFREGDTVRVEVERLEIQYIEPMPQL